MNDPPQWVVLHERLIDGVCELSFGSVDPSSSTHPEPNSAQVAVVISWLVAHGLGENAIKYRFEQAIAAELLRTPFCAVHGPLRGGLRPDCRAETQKPDLDPEQVKDRLVVLCAGRGFYCRAWGFGEYFLHPDGQEGTVAGALLCEDAAEALTVVKRWDAEKTQVLKKRLAADLAERTGVEHAPPCTAETKKTREPAGFCSVHGLECGGLRPDCRTESAGNPSAT